MNPYDGRVISNFIVQALRGEDITIYDDGSHSRSFCYIDDLVPGIVSFMNTGNGFTGPVNMGNPVETTIAELAELVLKLTDSGSGITYMPIPEDDPVRRRPDISLAKENLGWEPVTSLKDGLRETIITLRRCCN